MGSSCSCSSVQFVRRHRHDFKDPTSEYTSLCSAHFEESCYQKNLAVLSSMEAQGLKMNWCLKKDAVPTRDTIVPPAPEELSDRRKRQVRFPRVFSRKVCTRYIPKSRISGDQCQLKLLTLLFPYHYLYTSFHSLLFTLYICL